MISNVKCCLGTSVFLHNSHMEKNDIIKAYEGSFHTWHFTFCLFITGIRKWTQYYTFRCFCLLVLMLIRESAVLFKSFYQQFPPISSILSPAETAQAKKIQSYGNDYYEKSNFCFSMLSHKCLKCHKCLLKPELFMIYFVMLQCEMYSL